MSGFQVPNLGIGEHTSVLNGKLNKLSDPERAKGVFILDT